MFSFFDKILLTGFSFWCMVIALSLIVLSIVFLIVGVCTHSKSFGPFSNNEDSYHLLLIFLVLLNVAWGLLMLMALVEFIASFVYVIREMFSGTEFMLRFMGWLIVMVGLGNLAERIYGDGSRGVGRNTPYQKFQKYMEPPLKNR
jgi:hypothetical protein